MKGLLRKIVRPTLDTVTGALERLRWRGYYQGSPDDVSIRTHLQEAANWLVRAQDTGADRGVSYGARFGQCFDVSYPETTGYIIPTFIKLADFYQDETYLQRAIDMGNWEIGVQMECGAVMGGKCNADPTPAVFNTGQVLLGWATLYNRTRDDRFLVAARKAIDWMLEMQEEDGNWIRGNSIYSNPNSTLYNVKAAWGLCEAGKASDRNDAVKAAVRNAAYCLSHICDNGWIRDSCLTDASQPLLHTQAYTMQGLVGIGVLMNRPDFVDAARKTADALMALMTPDGFLPGRFDSTFRGTVTWSCLTGTAQTAIVWGRLYELTESEPYRAACISANRYMMARHDIRHKKLAIRGGVPGSWPVWGDYGKLAVVNWATNFFVEALLIEHEICGTKPIG